MRPGGIAEDGKALEIQIVLADSFVGFSSSAHAEKDISLNVIQIVEPNGQATFNREQIDDVDDVVDLGEGLPANDASQESFSRSTITGRVFSESLVAPAGGKNSRGLEDRLWFGEFPYFVLFGFQFS